MKTIRFLKPTTSLLAAAGLLVGLSGCGSSGAARSAGSGAAFGAMMGGIIGGDWESAAVGAAAGGGLGYVVGNEEDKQAAQAQAQRDREALAQARVSSDPRTAYQPEPTNPFVGSTWRVLSMAGKESADDWASIVISFQTNTRLTTLTLLKDGRAETSVETYRVVDDVLVITGADYLINARYVVEGKQLILVSPDLRVVLEEVEEGI